MSRVEAVPELGAILEPAPPRARRAPRPLLGAGLAVGIAALLPAIYLVVRGAEAGASGIADTLLDGRTAGLLVRTIGLAVAVTAGAVAIGVPLAWLTERTDLPGRRVWTVLAALPLVIPSFVGGYVFIAALGPRGLVQGWLEPLGVERLPSIYGFPGAWLVLTLFTYPYVFLMARAALRGLDPTLEDAARSLGDGRRAVLRRVVLPQLRPSIVAGALLVALYTLHDFGAVSLLRYDSFTRAIYLRYAGSFDRSSAALLALVLVAMTVLVLAAEGRARGRAAYHRSPAGARRPTPVVPLARARWPAFAGCALLALLALGVPMLVIGVWLARGIAAGEAAGVTWMAAWNSVRASGLGALAAVVLAWPVAVLAVRFPGRAARGIERTSFVGYALPGLVVALALVFFAARYAPAIYQTQVLLVFAYVVLFLPQATGALRASLLQVPPSLEEAAASLGSGRMRTARRIVLPLMRPGVLAGLALVFLTAMKELPATLLLAPTGFRTLAIEVWSATNAASFARAASPALVLIVIAAVPLALLLTRRPEGLR
ncbi:MAG TPA: iron ABC transporter permease [Actinomycetota bacterium]